MSLTTEGMLLVKRLQHEIHSVKTETKKGKTATPFFDSSVEINQPKTANELFCKIENKIGSIFSNYRLLGSKELNTQLENIKIDCEEIYDFQKIKASKFFDKIVANKSQLEVKHSYERLNMLIDELRALNLHYIAYDEEGTNEHLEDSIAQSLQHLKKIDEKLTKRIVRAQSQRQDPFIQLLWNRASDDVSHAVISNLEASLNTILKRNESTGTLKNRLLTTTHASKELEKAILKADLSNPVGRQALNEHLLKLKLKMAKTSKHIPQIFSDDKKSKEILASYKQIEHEIVLITQILTNYSFVPKTLEELQNREHPEEIREFCMAMQSLHRSNPLFADKLLRRLANKDQNPVLKRLSETTTTLNFIDVPIHIKTLEAFACIKPTIKKLEFSKLEGDITNVDVKGVSPSAAVELLRYLAPNLKKATIPAGLLTSKEFNTLMPNYDDVASLHWAILDWESKNRIRELDGLDPLPIPTMDLGCIFWHIEELYIDSDPKASPVPTQITDLRTLTTLFPHCHYVELPPLKLQEDENINLFDFVKLGDSLSQHDERYHHAIIRSLLQTGSLDDDRLWALTESMFIPNKLSPAHYVALFVSSGELNSKTRLFQEFRDADWQRVASLLIAAGKFKEFILPSENKPQSLVRFNSPSGVVDFSNTPMLDDNQFKGFLDCFNKAGQTNAQKIEKLRLNHCHQLKDESIQHLFKNAPALMLLDMQDNPQITDEAFVRIPKQCLDNLKVLDLRGTSVSRLQVKELQKKHPKLQIHWDERASAAKELYEKREASGNAALINGDKMIPIHSTALIASGLHATLRTEQNNRISLPVPLSDGALSTFVRYLYTRELNEIDESTAVELIRFSQHSGIDCPALTRDCRQWLIRTMTPENVLDRYHLAIDRGLNGVADAACRMMDLFLHPSYQNVSASLSDKTKNEIGEILKTHESIALKWLDNPTISIPLYKKNGGKNDPSEEVLDVDWTEVRSLVPPEFYSSVEKYLQETLSHMNKVKSSRQLPLFISLRPTPFNALEAIEQKKISPDRTFHLISESPGIPSQQLNGCQDILSGRSSFMMRLIAETDPNKPVEIKTKDPEALGLIIKAIMAGTKVEVHNMSLKQLSSLLKEADACQVAEQVLDIESIVKWVGQVSYYEENREEEFDPLGFDKLQFSHELQNMAWVDLLKWAKAYHCEALGVRIVLHLLPLLENEYYQKRLEKDPATKKILEAISASKQFKEFLQTWEKSGNTRWLDFAEEYFPFSEIKNVLW